MFFNRMFRERALRHRARQEPLDDRLQITAPHEWLIVAGLGLMLSALIAYGAFARVERTVSYDAVLLLPGERHYLIAPATGTVVDVLVKVTDIVAQGQPIAYVQTPAEQHRESVIMEIVDALEKSGRLGEGDRQELLQAVLDVDSGTGSASGSEIISPYGGEMAALDMTPGQPVSAGANVGLVRTITAGQPEIVTFVSPGDAERLSVGMRVDVDVDSRDAGAMEVLQGRVAHVSPTAANPPRWLSDRGLAVPQEPHELRVTLVEGEPDIPIADGAGVSLRVVLGHGSLASLLTPGRGD